MPGGCDLHEAHVGEREAETLAARAEVVLVDEPAVLVVKHSPLPLHRGRRPHLRPPAPLSAPPHESGILSLSPGRDEKSEGRKVGGRPDGPCGAGRGGTTSRTRRTVATSPSLLRGELAANSSTSDAPSDASDASLRASDSPASATAHKVQPRTKLSPAAVRAHKDHPHRCPRAQRSAPPLPARATVRAVLAPRVLWAAGPRRRGRRHERGLHEKGSKCKLSSTLRRVRVSRLDLGALFRAGGGAPPCARGARARRRRGAAAGERGGRTRREISRLVCEQEKCAGARGRARGGDRRLGHPTAVKEPCGHADRPPPDRCGLVHPREPCRARAARRRARRARAAAAPANTRGPECTARRAPHLAASAARQLTSGTKPGATRPPPRASPLCSRACPAARRPARPRLSPRACGAPQLSLRRCRLSGGIKRWRLWAGSGTGWRPT
jgi:hypothetical protein